MANPPPALADPLRSWVGSQVRRLLVGYPDPPAHFVRTADDPGLFGPDSMTWKVHGNLSMLVGGLRALLLQTMHPLAMAGVAQHSDYRRDPWGRVHRTASFIGTTAYAGTAEAERAIARVRAIHERVN